MIFNKIAEKCSENNISIATLERECGLGNGIIGKWKESSPTVEKLQKVADYFNTPIEYFLTK